MSLAPGARLGVYEIVEPIGAGGMGQVYRARDTALGRDVAIKILPDHFVADPERVARFEREARTLAALNHPHVAQIYGREGRALVMELVDGDDLEAVIARGAVPLPEALSIASQIAEALQAAHENGIVHRDLKPANVKVREDGSVKVLDFGLAKGIDASGSSSVSLANSPTITSPATELGVILGTAAYMSPEQARGKRVDRRADVWAFGVVLYEMLTGRRAFHGSEVSDVLASVLKETPALDALPDSTPASIRRLLRRCLEKDPSKRLDSMAAARLEIADALSPPAEDRPALAASQSRSVVRGLLVAAAVAVAALALGVFAGARWLRPPPAAAGRSVQFEIPLPPPLQDGRYLMAAAVTPSGDAVVFEADRLYVRALADNESRPLAGTEGARNLFVSPDGRWIGFYAGGKIRKIAFSGGDPLDVADGDADSPGAGWGPNNTILFSPGWNSPLMSVSADGGTPRQVSTVDAANGELGHWWPVMLPGEQVVLFTVWRAASGINDARIGALDLETGRHRVVMPGAYAQYLSSGELLYFHAGSYHVVPFDAAALRATGEPRKVLPDARPLHPNGTREKPVAVSRDGTLVYLGGALRPDLQLAWLTRSGAIEPLGAPLRSVEDLAMSPDGRRVVVTRIEGGWSTLWMRDLSRHVEQRLDLPGSSFGAAWGPNSDFFVFTSLRTGHFDVYSFRPDDGTTAPVIVEPLDQAVRAVTGDGRTILVDDYLADGRATISAALLEKPGARKLVVGSSAAVRQLRVSPDDKWMALMIMRGGRPTVVVQQFPGLGPEVAVSTTVGTTPLWARDGNQLFYRRDEDLMAVTYRTTGGRFEIEREEVLARLDGFGLVNVAPDGRFLVGKDVSTDRPLVRVVTNWVSELRK